MLLWNSGSCIKARDRSPKGFLQSREQGLNPHRKRDLLPWSLLPPAFLLLPSLTFAQGFRPRRK
jgi:hypothetical protein